MTKLWDMNISLVASIMNQISSTKRCQELLDRIRLKVLFDEWKEVRMSGRIFQRSGFMFSKWLDLNFVKINGWSKRSWKIPPVSCATVLAKVLAKKDMDRVRRKARCGCEMVGNHVRLDGDDTAQSPRPVHVFCSNNFAWFDVVFCFLMTQPRLSSIFPQPPCYGWATGGN